MPTYTNPTNGNIQVAEKKKWSILVYLAGGSDVSDAARDSLLQITPVGYNENFSVIAQFDSSSEGRPTKRYYLTQLNQAAKVKKVLKAINTNTTLKDSVKKFIKDTLLKNDEVADLGQTNAADPNVLKEFIKWGIE